MMKIEKETNERNIIEYPGEGGLWVIFICLYIY